MGECRCCFFWFRSLVDNREGSVEVVGLLQDAGDHRICTGDGLDEWCLFTKLVQGHQSTLVENRLRHLKDKRKNRANSAILKEDGR